MVLAGTLDQKNARTHPDKNVITRAIGAEDTLEIDFFREKVSDGNIVLMCSDGLTNMVEDSEIEEILGSSKSLEEAGSVLLSKANENGGADNISVLLVKI